MALLVVTGPLTGLTVGQSLGDTPETAYDGETLSPIAASVDSFIGFSPPQDAITYGAHTDLGYIVTYANNSSSSLSTWANASDRRRIVSWENDSNRALVVAPPPAVHGGLVTSTSTIAGVSVPSVTWVDGGLKERSYVEHIDLNVRHGWADPVTDPDTRDEYTHPPNALVRGKWSPAGVAFGDDVNASTLGKARDVTGVDSVSTTGSGVRVAVLDTGLNVDNTTDPSLYGTRIVAAHDFVEDESGLANVSTSALHGPWVASAIAANATNDSYDGMCVDCELVVGKVMADDGKGSTANIVDGIEWAEEQDADLVSMSLGSSIYSPTIAQSMREALEGNVTAIYVAVGNSRMNPAARYIASPADVPEAGVVAVGATDSKSPSNASTAYFSSVAPDGGRDFSNGVTVGEEVDIAAPGFKVTAPVYSENGYRKNHTLSGTSMATPVAAGIGALQLAANPSLENDTETFRGYAMNTSTPVPGAGITEVGAGMVNASNAVALSPSNSSQSSVRSDAAQSRDVANRAYSGAELRQWLASRASTSSITQLVGA